MAHSSLHLERAEDSAYYNSCGARAQHRRLKAELRTVTGFWLAR